MLVLILSLTMSTVMGAAAIYATMHEEGGETIRD